MSNLDEDKMKKLFQKLVFFSALSLLFEPTFCEKIKRFTSNGRNAGILEIQNVRSLLKCSIHFQHNAHFKSFNYHKNDQICELSSLYPESSTAEDGWSVYAYSVDGSWGNWLNWGPCSVTCGDGTMSRSRICNNPSPSNGGEQCQGSDVENQACNAGACMAFVHGYHLSTSTANWATAKAVCESASARLVIMDSQQKKDDLLSLNNYQAFDHWIGMTCNAGQDCVWLDGRRADSGYQSWAPNEPSGRDCVWIGWRDNNWDDTHCTDFRMYICELI